MLVKSRYLSLLNSSGIMTGRLYLTEKKSKRNKYCNYGFNNHSNKKVQKSQINLQLYKNVWACNHIFHLQFFFKCIIFSHKRFYINFCFKVWLLIIIRIPKLMSSIKFNLNSNVAGLQSHKKRLKNFEYLKNKTGPYSILFLRKIDSTKKNDIR